MSSLGHIFLFLGYALAAAVVGIVLPGIVPAVSTGQAMVSGLLLFLIFALAHEVGARRLAERRTNRRLVALKKAYDGARLELDAARREILELYGGGGGTARAREAALPDEPAPAPRPAPRREPEMRFPSALGAGPRLDDVAGWPGETGAARTQPHSAATDPDTTDPAPDPAPRLDAQAERRAQETEVRVLHQLVEALYTDKSGAAERTLEALPKDGAAAPTFAAAKPLPRGGLKVVAGTDDRKLLDIVRDGLRQDRVDLYLQPIVSLPQRKRRYFECYSRIRAEDGAVITPDKYLDVAQRAGLLTAVDNMLLFRCVQLLRKARQHDYTTSFFCNISAHTLSDRDFFSNFVDFMTAQAELAPNLVLEMGQADLAERFTLAAPDLERLKALGYRFSLDRVRDLEALDVERFELLAIEFVKIEARMILDRAAEGQAAPFRDLKRRLDAAGVDLIVEKIESEQELVELLDYGIDYGQGYLFGEPRISKDPEARGQAR